MSRRPIRVAVVSDQEIVSTGLRTLLGRHADRVEVVTPEDDRAPDVVLYDVLGVLEGDRRGLEQLVETAPVVLALSRDLRPDLVARALAAGAAGSVSLGAADEELLAAVAAAGVGRAPASPGSATEVAHRLGHDAGLTAREVDVVGLIALGLSNQQIAERCYLSINSVKTYIRSAYRRIGVSSRSQAVVWAMQHGFATETRADETTVG